MKASGPDAGHCFAQLMARHATRLRRRAARTLGDESEAEDVVQNVFTNIHRFLDRFTPDRPFGHWLSVVTPNACRIESADSKQPQEIGRSRLACASRHAVGTRPIWVRIRTGLRRSA